MREPWRVPPPPDAIVAVVLSGSFVLMIRRGPNGPDPGYWAPPSGKVESGERQEAAVIREVKEEVGVTIRPVRKVWESISAGGTHTLHWWLVNAEDRDLRPDRARSVMPAGWPSQRSRQWSLPSPVIVTSSRRY